MTDDEYDARYRCRWCRMYTHPVADFVARHQAVCVAKPNEVDE